MPSQTETLGLVMLEAHASGLPVIAADSPAARELVNDPVDGLRFDPNDPGALAAMISCLIDDPQRLVWMSRQARRATGGADWRRATAALRSHYLQASQDYDPLAAAA